MESALYGVYTLVALYQKSHSFASLTRSISYTPQLVCKHRTHALSMKYSILTSAAISVDRLLALLVGLRYRHVLRLRRVRVVIICFWLIGALSGWTWMQTPDLAYKEAFVILTLSLGTI